MDGPSVEMSSRSYLESGRTVWVVFLVSVLHVMGNGPPSGGLNVDASLVHEHVG